MLLSENYYKSRFFERRHDFLEISNVILLNKSNGKDKLSHIIKNQE